jgi:hypothetical protein
VSAEKDGLAPPDVVEAGYREWNGPKRRFECGRDFGHTDLLLGRGAPETVFPAVTEFLLENSELERADRDARSSPTEGSAWGEQDGMSPKP